MTGWSNLNEIWHANTRPYSKHFWKRWISWRHHVMHNVFLIKILKISETKIFSKPSYPRCFWRIFFWG